MVGNILHEAINSFLKHCCSNYDAAMLRGCGTFTLPTYLLTKELLNQDRMGTFFGSLPAYAWVVLWSATASAIIIQKVG